MDDVMEDYKEGGIYDGDSGTYWEEQNNLEIAREEGMVQTEIVLEE